MTGKNGCFLLESHPCPSLWARLFLIESWRLTINPKRTAVLRLNDRELQSIDVVDVGVEKALLWHAVSIRTQSGVNALSGLTGDGAQVHLRLRSELLRHFNIHFAELIDEDNWLSNRVFGSYTEIIDHCCDAWNKLIDQPDRIKSIGTRQWAHGS